MSNISELVTILDVNALVKQCYNIGDDAEALIDEDGERVNRWQYGAQKFLQRYEELVFSQDNFCPRMLFAAQDMGSDYRTALLPAYKAKRKARKKSDVQIEQMRKLKIWVKNFFAAIGATQVGVEGVEADDVIAWLCESIGNRAVKQVLTVDGDLAVLADDDTVVLLKGEPVQDEEYQGVPCKLLTLYKSIVGDTSDEYPGVKGMGPKAWEQLFEAYGEDGMFELDAIVKERRRGDLEALEDKCKNLHKLLENFDQWRLSYLLAQLHPELCWKPRGKKMTKPIWYKRVPNEQQVRKCLEAVGAMEFFEVIEETLPRQILIDADNWAEMKEDIFAEIRKGDITSFDYETTDHLQLENLRQAAKNPNYVNMLAAQLTGAGFTFGRHLENTVYFTIDHKTDKNLPAEVVLDMLEVADEHTQLVVQNFYFEGTVTRTNFDVTLSDVHDTMIMQRYVNENDDADLKGMASQKIGYKMATYEETVGEGRTMSDLTPEDVMSYGCDDPLATGHLYDLLRVQLMAEGCWDWYCTNAVNASVVMVDSYVNGTRIDWELLEQIRQSDIETLEKNLKRLRELLAENCTGTDFSGARSYIAHESEFIRKRARKKLRDKAIKGGLTEPTDQELKEAGDQDLLSAEETMFSACKYRPYVEERTRPAFSPTEKQLNAAIEKLGLEPLEGTALRDLDAYLSRYGMVGFTNVEVTPEQEEFLKALAGARADGVFQQTKLRKKVEVDNPDEKDIEALQYMESALEKLAEVTQRYAEVEDKVSITGDELNIGSPVQMAQILYCKLGAKVRLTNKIQSMSSRQLLGMAPDKGTPSTDEYAIKMAMAMDIGEDEEWKKEAMKALLEAKSCQTRLSLYHTPYPLWKHQDGKLHPSFRLCGTDTRRPTGGSPNVLQVSKKDKRLRNIFIPPNRDWVVVSIDYASQELRLIAVESGDSTMRSVYDPADEKDLHSMSASGIMKMSYEDFMQALADGDSEAKATRQWKAKPVNFGMTYGAMGKTLSRQMSVPVDEASALLDSVMATYPGIQTWQERTGKFMEKNGFTVTAFGTKRHATDDLYSGNRDKVNRQHRQGTNSTIQGTAAEMLMKVLTEIHSSGMLQDLRMVFFAPIYDETVAYVHKDDVAEYCERMQVIMSAATPPTHDIPQVPEFTIGPFWGGGDELGRWPGREAINAAVEKAVANGAETWDRIDGVAA